MEHAVIAWLREAGEPAFPKARLEEYYQTISPRVVFLKNLPQGSRVLDLGAGGGELAILRDWPSFARADLRLFAVSLQRGAYFDRYAEVFIGDFEKSLPEFSTAQFEAVMCAHFIEHVRDFRRAMRWIVESLVAGGCAYIEWPHPVSKDMPTKFDLIKLGYAVSTINFFDDRTHVETWDMDDLLAEARRHGCVAEAWGRIRWPFLADEMRNCAIRHKDETMLTFAIWSFAGWAQYIVVRKTG